MNHRGLLGALAGTLAITALATSAFAADVIVRGNVVSVSSTEKTFRVKQNDAIIPVATKSTTTYRFTTGAPATFAEIKVGRYVEAVGSNATGRIVANRVSIRK